MPNIPFHNYTCMYTYKLDVDVVYNISNYSKSSNKGVKQLYMCVFY